MVGVYSNVGKHLYYDGKTNVPTKVMFDFICDYESGTPTTSNETSEVIWVPKHEVLGYISSPAQIYRFKRVLDFQGQISYSSYVTKPTFNILSERYF